MGVLRVWADVLTPKQVLFFNPVIEKLRESGCQVLLTSRKYREVEPMAQMVGLKMQYVGERGGKGKLEQLMAATERQGELIPIVNDFQPQVSFSLASGACARISFGMGVKHIAVNDSPHSEVAGRLSIPFSHRLMCPWIIPYKDWAKFGINKSRITRYRALDPAAWLKRKPMNGPVPEVAAGKKTIVVRVEESDAPYMAGSDENWTDEVLTGISHAFPDCNFVALCRYGHQLDRIKRKYGTRFVVPDGVVDGRGLLAAADLFIGMGGTMTAEAALIGVPAISTFQGSYLVEDYLKSVGLLVKSDTIEGVVRTARRFLADSFKISYSKRSKNVLDAMEDPVPKIAGLILKTAGQG